MNFNFFNFKCLFIFLCLFTKINSLDLLNSKIVLNVHGNSKSLNFYYITLFLGKEKQNQTYLLDTTSSVTTSPCSLCHSCGDHINEYYTIKSNSSIINSNSSQCLSLPNLLKNLSNSNNYIDSKKCIFFEKFEDSSHIQGVYINNIINFEPITSKINNQEDEEDYISDKNEYEMPIGCSLEETGGFQTRMADGKIGLNNNHKSFISMIYNRRIIKKNLFSLCFDESGGYFSLGEIDSKYHISSNINYVNLLPFSELYELEIKNIIIYNNEYNKEIFNNYTSIIDSSSTISYFPKDIFNNIIDKFISICSGLNGKCGKIKNIKGNGICVEFKDLNELNNSTKYHWPKIKIKFNGYDYIWKPKNYYMDYSSSNKIRVCLGFQTNENITNIILGTTFMHGYDIIFDRENNRIGFSEADCGRNNINERKIKKENNKNKINENKNFENQSYYQNNKASGLIIFFAFLIVLVILFIFDYINCDCYNLQEIKDHTLIKNDIEDKDINNSKSIGQIIEMVNDNENK